jgi:metal-responsive CopG/Arc/MetJ family transcriptional regulator
MASVKTAISVDKPLFDEVDALAQEMEVSRSYLFTLAVREFVQRRKSQKTLEAVNAAHDDVPDPAEASLQTRMRRKHRELVKDQW